jgi:hypothetical protein
MKIKRYQCEKCKRVWKHIDMFNDKYCYECVDIVTGELKEVKE